MTKRKLIDADALIAGLYDENPKDVAMYIANFPEADLSCMNSEKMHDTDDLISRQASIDEFYSRADDDGYVCYSAEDMEGIIKTFPSVQPEVAKDTNVPCKDTIDRQLAIDAFKPYAEYESNRSNKDWVKRIEVILSDLPSAQPEPNWIPCVDGNEPKANAECWISTSEKYVRRASYAPKANNQPNGFIVTDGIFGFYKYGKSAKAWMPYTKEPEPYREEGD